MNEIEIIKLQVDTSASLLSANIMRYYNVLHELRRMSVFLFNETSCTQSDIDNWFKSENFGICKDGFWQSISNLTRYRQRSLSENAISYSCHPDLRYDHNACFSMYIHRNIGRYLADIQSRLTESAWIYYQDSSNIAFQYPFIDQSSAITPDFNWSTYHTWISVNQENNPGREIKWTAPSYDYAGKGVIISASIPIYVQDTFKGLWSIDIPIKTLYQTIFGKQIPEQQHFISDYRGNIISHPHIETRIDKEKGSIFQEKISSIGGGFKTIDQEKLISSQSGQIEILLDDRRKYDVFYRIIPEIEWIFYSTYPKDNMIKIVNHKVKSALDKVRSGDYSYRLQNMQEGPSNNILVKSFNEMAEALEVQHQQILESQKHIIQAEKNNAIGTLAGGIAHDFNNILTSILGFTELAMQDVLQGNSQKDSLKEVYAAGMRAKQLVQQILAFARQSSEEVEPIKFREIIDEMLKLLRPTTPSTIEIIADITNNLSVNGNASQLHQIVMNLCTNAIYSMQETGGVLKIELNSRTLENSIDRKHNMLPAGEYAELTITDNGPGIKAHIIGSIFEPYFTTKAVGQGTGMGLAVVEGIIKSYGGDIQAKSDPDKQTIFTIRLPVATDTSTETGNRTNTVAEGSERILFVDDEPTIARMGYRMLEAMGYKVTCQTNSLEALELFKKLPDNFDLVITDMTMPSMTGDVLSLEVRKVRPDIPIILCTGYSNTISEERAKQIGINAFAFKPFTRSELSLKIKEVMDAQ